VPRRASRTVRLAVPLALLAVLDVACRRAPPPGGGRHVVRRLVADRWQAVGEVSTSTVPTVVLQRERRPVLATTPTGSLGTYVIPASTAGRMEATVDVPEALRGRSLALSLVGKRTAGVVLRPRRVRRAGATLRLRLAYAKAPGNTVVVLARANPDPDVVTAPFDVPPAARLRFGIGLDGDPPATPPVAFTVTALDDTREREVFATRVPGGRGAWSDHEVDLGSFAGRSIRLRFTAAVTEPGFPVHPVWADPELLAPVDALPWNVLLVSLDTLRADRVRAYGHRRPTSPVIDRLATESALFERAYAHFPGTSGSHMTLFTGLLPCVHGVEQLGLTADDRLRPDLHTLAELLRAAGWTTAGWTENGWVTAAPGFARGFGTYVENTDADWTQLTGHVEETFRGGRDWIAAHRDEPWFLFLHTYEVHEPYTPPPRAVARVLGRERTRHPREPLASALYDAEIRYTDEVLGRFLADLDGLGLAARTLVIVFSDHGEHFGERGLWEHGNSLYEPLLHVPLVVRAPGRVPPGRRIAAPVGLIDVTPTVLAFLGLPAPRWSQGRNLLPLFAERRIRPSALWAELPSHRLLAARIGPLKWIIHTADPGATEAYDLTRDPEELRNVAGLLNPDQPGQLAAAHAHECRSVPPLQAGTAAPPAPAPPAAPGLDPAVRDKLRALGYVE
jgi:arylsulfatase A-like enzyme